MSELITPQAPRVERATVAFTLPAKTRAAEPVTAPQPANTLDGPNIRDVPDTRAALATA